MSKIIVLKDDSPDIIIDHEKATSIKDDLYDGVNIHIIEEKYDCMFHRKDEYLMVE